jgi:exosortase E/protease (VPEID-CTERM system)
VALSTIGQPFRVPLLPRVLAFIALLIGEYLLISFLFDARTLLREGAGSLAALGYLGDAATIALVATAAVLALMGPALRRAVSDLPEASQAQSVPWSGALAHAGAYGVFVAVTAQLFGPSAGPRGLWLGAWVVAGAVLVATWLPLALPWAALRALWPRLSSAVLAGAVAGVLAWAAGEASASIWREVAPLTLAVVAAILRQLVPAVVVDDAAITIGTPQFMVQIAPICSGFEGIGLILAFLGGYMLIERKNLRFPRAFLLLPFAVATVWTANAVRIALLIVVGDKISPAIALGGFHSKAGWLLFCAIALGFIALARNARYFASAPAEAVPAQRAGADNPVAPYLMPELVLIGTGLVTGLAVVDFDALYAVRIAAAAVAAWMYREHYHALRWQLHWESVAIGVVVFVIWLVLARGGDAQASSQLQHALRRIGPGLAAAWLGARLIGTVLVVPFVEELAFRGYLLRRLSAADFDNVDARKPAVIAGIVSSLAFGLLHADWLAGAVAGAAFAFAQQRRGRVTDAIIAHAVTNLLLALDALVLGGWRWLA